MPGWLLGLLLFVVVCVLVSWGARRMAIVGGRLPLSYDNSPPGGDRTGTLADYFAKMTELEGGTFDHFFVTITDPATERFIQVSAGLQKDGRWDYRFDIPINEASAPFEDEVKSRIDEFDCVFNETKHGGMRFLEIDFADRAEHDAFSRWVFVEVFGAPETTRGAITWG